MCDSESIVKTDDTAVLNGPQLLDHDEIRDFVDGFVRRRGAFLQTRRRHGSPLYVLDEIVLLERARQFTEAFGRVLDDVRVYYAMKSNNHPQIARRLVAAGLGLDVSSGVELQSALETGVADIVFSGPGKTDEELALAVDNSDRTTVLIDSFGELERLEPLAARKGASIRAGVRLATERAGLWRKFGIPLTRLSEFLAAAQQCDYVSLRGLQFHVSWNLDGANQVEFIRRLGGALAELTRSHREMVEFVDVGGGFWPARGEWLQSADPYAVAQQDSSAMPSPGLRHYKRCAADIDEFARQIAQAVGEHIRPHLSCRICVEPGRWLCNDAMHLLLTVVDRKEPDLVIADGGTNAIGWERFETDYFPVINLSRPDLTERACHILGSLCTPHDVWGYAYWGKDIQPGDVLLIPMQGAYTYSLRQQFIKPIPKVATLYEAGQA